NKNKLSKIARIAIALGGILLIILAFTAYTYYQLYFKDNVAGDEKYLYIRTGSDFEEVMKGLSAEKILKDEISFRTAAEEMNYGPKIKPGRYKFSKGAGNRQLINMLKAGNQAPVNLFFRSIRQKNEFAGRISKLLEADSAELVHLLDSEAYVKQFGFNKETVYAMFIPNSYEMYWNTSAEEFFERMNKEYEKFWTSERTEKARAAGLTPVQVSILASIVDAEALHDDEMPMIAGLYLNRIRKGIRLQADPTVIFAAGDFTIRRVLNKHLRISSPYNTYLNAGLPPGPIMMPSINAIDAVLNHKKHDYIYMCAKDDFSGYHNYAVTEAQHLVNARKFQQALNVRNIKR
ncbi:MAG TPA: endolytic transglycosylase MltG, partial [Sphingobacteriaceae bacterium]